MPSMSDDRLSRAERGRLDGRIRIAVIISEARATGLVRQLFETLSRLEHENCEVKVALILRSGVDSTPITSELSSRGIRYEVLREASAWDPGLVPKANQFLSSWGPDLVQTHGYKPNALGLLAHRRLGLPWVAFYHGRTATDLKVRVYHHLNCQVMSHANTIVAVAHGVQGHLPRRARKRVRVIENAVIGGSGATCSREECRKRLRLQPHEHAVGFVGRLSHEKGPDLFLESFALLVRRVPDARAVIVGDGPLRESLVRTAALLGVERKLEFHGFVEEMGDVYSALDLVVISSRSEVFPNVLLEAVSAGIPVVATRVGGIPFIIEGLKSVLPVDPGDPRALALAMETALLSRLESAAGEARTRLRQRFSLDRRVAKFLELYHDILPGPSETAT